MEKNKVLNQWHETKKIREGRDFCLMKYYEPNSYEIRNELSWITSTILRNCQTFTVPVVSDSSIREGFIKMMYVTDIKISNVGMLAIDRLIECAIELHSLIRSKNPHMRTQINEGEYTQYVERFVQPRITIVNEYKKQGLSDEVVDWIVLQIRKLHTPYFTIVHRDFRCRHLLDRKEGRPVLIDWEYSNISDPAQDLAKLTHDGVVNLGFGFRDTLTRIVDSYSTGVKESADELTERVFTFIPIITLEHLKSFILRKPKGYEREVKKDLLFIYEVYNAKN